MTGDTSYRNQGLAISNFRYCELLWDGGCGVDDMAAVSDNAILNMSPAVGLVTSQGIFAMFRRTWTDAEELLKDRL